MRDQAIYHGEDVDGQACGAMLRAVGLNAFAYQYGEPLPPGVRLNKLAIIADVSLDEELMHSWAEVRNAEGVSPIWVDHHKPIHEKLKDTFNGVIVYDEYESAALLLFRHLFPGQPIPHNLQAISDYDTWQHKSTTYHHQLGFQLIDNLHIEDICDDSKYQDHIKKGSAIAKYVGRTGLWTLERSWAGMWHNKFCLFVNADVSGKLFEQIDEKYVFLVGYYQLPNWGWKISLRSSTESCGRLSAEYGGGGHDGAGGFRVNDINELLREVTPL